MTSVYILRFQGKLISLYSKGERMLYKIHENGAWGAEQVLVAYGMPRFSVTLNDKGLTVIWSDHGKQVHQSKTQDLVKWEVHPLNLPVGYSYYPHGSQGVYTKEDQHMVLDETVIDRYKPSKVKDLEVQQVTQDHSLIFYQSIESDSVKNAEGRVLNNIGYREVSGTAFGGFKPIHTSYYQILDHSFLTTTTGVHSVYVVKTLFSYQLIYKSKTGEAFDAPVLLMEGARMDHPLLMMIHGKVHVFFQQRGSVYVSVKEAHGFTGAKPYKNKVCQNLMKASYLSESPMDEGDYFLRDVYVDTLAPWDVQLLPDLYDQFYFVPPVTPQGPYEMEAPIVEEVPPHWHFQFAPELIQTAKESAHLSETDLLLQEISDQRKEIERLRKIALESGE